MDQDALIDWSILNARFCAMTATAMLDLKQRLAQLTEAERKVASAYLLRLKRESATGRRRTSRVMREMDSGKKTPLRDIVAA